MMEQKEKVRFRSFSIKEEKGRTTLLARKRVVKSQLTMFLILCGLMCLQGQYKIQNTKYNTKILMCLKGPGNTGCGQATRLWPHRAEQRLLPQNASDHRELDSERGDKFPSLVDEKHTLLVITVEMFVDASLALLCSSAPSQY